MANKLDHVQPDITAREFFDQYITKRKPVIIKGLPDDPTFRAEKWTDLDYLSSKAGAVDVMVEPMHPKMHQFGTDAQRVSMLFSQFLASLKEECGPRHYLTTQYSGKDLDGDALTVFSPPTDALADDYPTVPRLMGNLVPQQVNLWLGKSNDGSSSGLHHDFHDNLYCLLRGRKRFVLYPPSEHEKLYPYKSVHTLHPNGVIAYDWLLRADGLDDRTALQARFNGYRRLLYLKKKEAGTGKGKGKEDVTKSEEYRRLYKEYEEAKEDLVALAAGQDCGPPLDDPNDDEYGYPDCPLGWIHDGMAKKEDDDDDDDEDDDEEADNASDTGSFGSAFEHGQDDYETIMDSLEADILTAANEGASAAAGGATLAQDEEPASFSRIPTAYLHKHLNLPTTAIAPVNVSPKKFPKLAQAASPYILELSAGEMLYLPASWWHEVTSFSAGGAGAEKGSNMHMAFNYWFYPPDADKFVKPYADELSWEWLRLKASKEQEARANSKAAEKQEGKRKREREEESIGKKVKR